jgi:hypothetical protein
MTKTILNKKNTVGGLSFQFQMVEHLLNCEALGAIPSTTGTESNSNGIVLVQ